MNLSAVTVEESSLMCSRESPVGALDQAASDFMDLRPRLFGIAYRMLGSATEAEDIVQDVWVRWQNTDRSTVVNPPAFLVTVTTRLAINSAQSARARRETYIGPWLPEPVDTAADPEQGAERDEAIGLAVLLLLEKLNPRERAVYVLREAFGYPYAEIADILQLGVANTRQLAARGRKHIAAEQREPVSAEEHRRLLKAFLAAAQTGELAVLEKLFAADVVSFSDGGGAVRGVSRFPVVGRTRVAKFIRAWSPRFWPGTDTSYAELNGQPGLVVSRDGRVINLISFDASAEGIHRIMWVMNPAKLTRFSTPDATSGAPVTPGQG